ncbi:segregation and condensation protein A [Micromonospora krabiensis]|uniref:Segregation and condensation protein A n=1 Tax=Micromonospora krabiensis TaxID=307121 RepID=A0A1C3N1Q4_9ACTN|nr:ScpA family protein [Micromonospora krabiensis]SBV26496.1 condensin subunit ScpA [Micromonospora krabiensis]
MTAPPLDPPSASEQPLPAQSVRPAEPGHTDLASPSSSSGSESSSGPESSSESGSSPDPGPAEASAPEASAAGAEPEAAGFTVRLANFTGPFDLLLQLIGKHKLDVTEVALHRVTDEFIAYIRAMGDQWDLDEASEFLLIAATLLDLKAARLLPAAEVEDEEDLALLEARDLLFARLLQYKAYKEAAAHIGALEAVGGRRYPRAVTLEPRYAEALPELVLGVGPQRLLKLALRALTPKPVPEVSIAHVHMVRVSVREHAAIITERLRRAGVATFSLLCADCEATLEVVARFLALLELYREGLVAFVQEQALEELTVRWTGPAEGGPDLQIDEYAGTPADETTPPPTDPAAPPSTSPGTPPEPTPTVPPEPPQPAGPEPARPEGRRTASSDGGPAVSADGPAAATAGEPEPATADGPGAATTGRPDQGTSEE